MAKKTNSVRLKGSVDVDFSTGVGTVTETIKDVEYVYNLFEILEQFDGKSVTISITEENELPTVDEA